MIKIAEIKCDFPTKFGLPRQSGLADIPARVVFEKEYSDENAFRGLSDFSHVWILWGFSGVKKQEWSPMVRPPRLGGNTKMGVFATRSPYRPNQIGLSCVKLEKIERQGDRIVVFVTGADIMDGTPVYDIKPYLPNVDCVAGAKGGFSSDVSDYSVKVAFLGGVLDGINSDEKELLIEILSQDPRPSYIDDGDRVYGFFWKDKEIKFKVQGGELTVLEIRGVK